MFVFLKIFVFPLFFILGIFFDFFIFGEEGRRIFDFSFHFCFLPF